MDKIKFARLVAFLVKLTGHNFDEYEIRQIDEIASIPTAPSARDVRDLLMFMQTYQKIHAIKAFRSLTGDGLKESKDAVEAVMNKMAPEHALVAS